MRRVAEVRAERQTAPTAHRKPGRTSYEFASSVGVREFALAHAGDTFEDRPRFRGCPPIEPRIPPARSVSPLPDG
jgi:hypothetical protein